MDINMFKYNILISIFIMSIMSCNINKKNNVPHLITPEYFKSEQFPNTEDTESFGYSAYELIDIQSLLERGSILDNSSIGVKVFNSKIRMLAILKEMPTKGLQSEERSFINFYLTLFPQYREFMGHFNYRIKLKYKDQFFIFLFQDTLIPPLKKSNKEDLKKLYCFHSMYSESSKTHLLLVTAFIEL